MHFLKRGRRSQITIFIVIAVVILLVFLLAFFLKNKSAPTETGTLDVSSFKNGLEGCLDISATDGLRAVGQHGGYVSLREPMYTGRNFVGPGFSTTDGEYVTLGEEGSELDIPYWYHLSTRDECSGNCAFSVSIPPLEGGTVSVQRQLEYFVKDDVRSCVEQQVKAVEDLGFSMEIEDVAYVSTNIRDNDVQFSLVMPIRLTKGDEFKDLGPVTVTKDVPLRKMYNIAVNITNTQRKYKYLEKQALDLISVFSHPISDSGLPPMGDDSYEFANLIYWIKSDVRNNVMNMLADYVPLFFLDDRATKRYTVDQDDDAVKQIAETILNSAQVPLDDKGLDVQFSYLPWWKPYFDLNCRGELCAPDSYTNTFGGILFGYQDYSFLYDLSYPVVVTIKDDKARCCGDDGYRFMFALESNIRSNQPLEEEYVELNSIEQESTLCDYSKRDVSIPVNVTDKKTGLPIDDVFMSYKVTGNDCFAGVTKKGLIEAEFPSGIFGKVELFHPDYAISITDVQIPGDERLDIQLEPYRDMKVSLKKRMLKKDQTGLWDFDLGRNLADLSSSEVAVLSFQRIPEDAFAPRVVATAMLNVSKPSETVRLVPGKYQVSVQIMNDEPITIYPDDRSFNIKKGVPPFDSTERVSVFIPEEAETIERHLSGAMLFDENSGYLELTAEDLDENSNLELRVPAVAYIEISSSPYNPELKIEDLSLMGELEGISAKYRYSLSAPILS